jgi:membrane protease YdiL (CAAX protease family)
LWLGTNRLTLWPVAPAEFAFLILLAFGAGIFLLAGIRAGLGGMISRATDRPGLEVIFYTGGFHAGALLGWLLFPFLRRRWHADYGAAPPAETADGGPLSLSRTLLAGAATVVAALPVITVLSLGWVYVLKVAGLPEAPQDAIAIFANTKSPVVVAGMLVVACVVAPINEELLFRAGLYRFCRQRLGREAALVISGSLFGAMHGNWASFLPLAVLGALLALAYEATGNIRVAMVAHSLFNLNTIVFVLSGLPS